MYVCIYIYNVHMAVIIISLMLNERWLRYTFRSSMSSLKTGCRSGLRPTAWT